MSSGTRIPLADAQTIAGTLLLHLSTACDRIVVAGSVRRKRVDVGDIELVAIPKLETEQDGMFGQVIVNRLSERIGRCIADAILAPHPTDPKMGDRYSKLIEPETGLQVDIFSARPETWGIILLIRTGPAPYSARFVTDLHGRQLHAAGGELHRGSGSTDHKGWHPPLGCPDACQIVPAHEEQGVYDAAGWLFIAPEERA